jgi:hypothetical protein
MISLFHQNQSSPVCEGHCDRPENWILIHPDALQSSVIVDEDH